MNEMINIFGGITVKELILYGAAIYWLYSLSSKLYKKISSHHDREQEKDELFKLVKDNSKRISELSDLLNNLIIRDNEYKLRSLADKLFVCYNSAKRQGFITPRQLENFNANAEVYYDLAGGGGIVKKKYEPEILNMDVREYGDSDRHDDEYKDEKYNDNNEKEVSKCCMKTTS